MPTEFSRTLWSGAAASNVKAAELPVRSCARARPVAGWSPRYRASSGGGQARPPTGQGERLPELIVLAGMTTVAWQQVRVRCYGQTHTKELASLVCLWHTVFGAQPCGPCSCVHPVRPTATSWPWSPPTWTPPPRCWSNATRPGGAWRSGSRSHASSWGLAKPVTEPQGCAAHRPVRAAVRESGRLLVHDPGPARPGRGRPPRPLTLVPAQARGLVRRHAHRADMLTALQRAILTAQYRLGHLLAPTQQKSSKPRLPGPPPPQKCETQVTSRTRQTHRTPESWPAGR